MPLNPPWEVVDLTLVAPEAMVFWDRDVPPDFPWGKRVCSSGCLADCVTKGLPLVALGRLVDRPMMALGDLFITDEHGLAVRYDSHLSKWVIVFDEPGLFYKYMDNE